MRFLASPSNGSWGWLGLAGFILGYDAWAIASGRETLTRSFQRAMKHPLRRWPVAVAVGVTVLHLYDQLPARLDPFGHLANVLKRLDPLYVKE